MKRLGAKSRRQAKSLPRLQIPCETRVGTGLAMPGVVSSRLIKGVGALRQRLSRREDTEHVQALIRIGFGLVVSAYLYSTIGPRFDIHVVCTGFEVLAFAIFLAILIYPQPSALRRGLGALLDLGTTTYLMWTNAEVAPRCTVSIFG